MEQKMQELSELRFNKDLKDCTNAEIYYILLEMTKNKIKQNKQNAGKKKLYYISAEFLIGKLLSNNLINLGIYKEVKSVLEKYNKSLSAIEAIELEPSLGNGGLGRLAACFLDSIATLGLSGDGIGLNYHFGLFQQVFQNNKQKEVKNPWITKDSWLNKTDICFNVSYKNFTASAKMYDIDIIGYKNGYNKLHLFDIESLDETLVKEDISFNKEDILHNLTLFLYPDDSDRAGNLLRIYQQYFMVCCAAQFILKEQEELGHPLEQLASYAVIQINDTHPTMVIPELIRQLVERGISFDKAIEIVSNTCAYTNHTILAEALEKWPLEYLEEVVPQLVSIIKELDKRIKDKYKEEKVAIIDKNNLVHMAHIDIHYGYSVNGVAALHTEILKKEELNHFYQIYPEKFNNKTNGITFRRWLMHTNQELTEFLDNLIGEKYHKDASKLKELRNFLDDTQVLNQLLQIKQKQKACLKEYLYQKEGILIDENSIFDIQVKRLHEYKRQQMNALYIIYKYMEIKKGNVPDIPITMIFGAKAAPAYTIAKDIIHLILCLSKLIKQDKEVNPYLKVVMVENYNVTYAEKLIPACDISEQISLASKEASGTGNMKFMLNGAITLGTIDGANVEISDLVGRDNIYIFGASSEAVIEHYRKADYSPADYYGEDEEITKLLDFIIHDELLAIGDSKSLHRLFKEFVRKDWFMTLLDLKDYIKVKEKALQDYKDRIVWAKKMLINISEAGFFSSDRTIQEYNQDIWHL